MQYRPDIQGLRAVAVLAVMVFLRYYTCTEVLDVSFSVLFVILTVLLSIVLYYCIEVPLCAKRTNIKQMLAYGTIAFMAFGASKSTAKVNKLLSPPPLPIEYTRYADPATTCHGQIVGDCLKYDLSSDKEVLVLGDSHAVMLNHFFDYLGKELGFKARIITASSCVTISRFDYDRIAEYAKLPCLMQIKSAQEFICSNKTIFLAWKCSFHLENDAFKTVLINFINYVSLNFNIYILSQIPILNIHPSSPQRFASIGIPINTKIDDGYFNANKSLTSILPNDKMVYMELNNIEVFNSVLIFNNQLIYIDTHNTNEFATKEYIKQVIDVLQSVMAD